MNKGNSNELRKGRVNISGQIYHLIFSTVEREQVFDFDKGILVATGFNEQKILLDNEVICWTIMPDHIHILLRLRGYDSIGDFVRRFKARASFKINKKYGYRPSIWQDGYFDRAIRQDEDIKTIARYIIANPIRAGICTFVGNYSLWNACWI